MHALHRFIQFSIVINLTKFYYIDITIKTHNKFKNYYQFNTCFNRSNTV